MVLSSVLLVTGSLEFRQNLKTTLTIKHCKQNKTKIPLAKPRLLFTLNLDGQSKIGQLNRSAFDFACQ